MCWGLEVLALNSGCDRGQMGILGCGLYLLCLFMGGYIACKKEETMTIGEVFLYIGVTLLIAGSVIFLLFGRKRT